MNIVFVGSEAYPFAKTGGLADVLGALPAELAKNGNDISIIMPYYKRIKDKKIATFIGNSFININHRNEYVGVLESEFNGVTYYFIDNESYFYRDELYGYWDDGERFSFFCFAVLEALHILDIQPDILHLNDWQTGLIPYIIKNKYYHDPLLNNVKTIFSIHNIQYQGIFPTEMFSILDIDYSDGLIFNNCINFLKSAIVFADAINTVSENYRNETLTKEYSYGLENILNSRYNDYYGIVNGIDIMKYNPLTDPNILLNYSIENVNLGKLKNKRDIQDIMHLPKRNVPLYGLISRLVDQKGLDILMNVLEDFIANNQVQVVVIGSGDKRYEEYFINLSKKYQNKFACYIGYSDVLAQKVYAASDFFLMPSRFEPCGLGQLIASRYGTLPIVRETGGLKDTVKPFNEYTLEGTGFSFSNYSNSDLSGIINYSYKCYQNKIFMNALIKNAMSEDYSWHKSAQKYTYIYEKYLGGK